MDDPLTFLETRLHEDSEAARAVSGATGGMVDSLSDRYGPARVLREVAAKRRTLDRHTPRRTNVAGKDGRVAKVTICDWDHDEWPCADVLDLASVYADHPDYQVAWRP
ncbi:DUF6221 family protein [Streptomyces sp. NBC_01207]|uniref:DUF6221 family protein n=1 Tax=Streptomyces sp. NBC_01207 TaxID=2903772 RepID=UPI002E1409BF|nr:DUF6221 family protein [Streptomyces sp. NBC_01207]